MTFRPTAIFFAASAALAWAQSNEPPSPKFEVASVKRSGPQSIRNEQGGPGTKDPAHYRFQLASLQNLIGIAWNVQSFQISSKSAIDKDRFDVIANVPEGATRDQFRQMMRNLLAERFQLKTHLESKDFPVYELVIAKNGLRLKDSAGASESSKTIALPEGFPTLPAGPGLVVKLLSRGAYQLVWTRGQQQPISELARALRAPGQEPIIDKTGLTGKYDFTLEYTMDTPAASDAGGVEPPPAPGIFTALQEQLGLQLVAKKLAFDVVVVESFERTPAGN